MNVTVKVWGELACFTRPEMKVERMSYPIMTPSAARGVLDAILWKPQMCWHVQRITALPPVTREADANRSMYELVSVRRNEISGRISTLKAKEWMADPDTFMPYLVDSAGRDSIGGANRTQRNTLALRDVAYLIHASPILSPKANQPRAKPLDEDEDAGPDSVAKYIGMFERRVRKGQCFHRPYLGCREFACQFGPPNGREVPLPWNESLGLMLYDVRFHEGQQLPGFFRAEIKQGVLHCDSRDRGPHGDSPVEIVGWPREVTA